MTVPASPGRAGVPVALLVGVALWGLTTVWWFSYYSQYDGWLGQLGEKAPCVFMATDECSYMQKRLLGSAIPRYHPELFWAGLIAVALGIVQRESRRR